MTYEATAFKIFLASPSDMVDERKIAREVIQEWNFVHSEPTGIVLMPIGWETHAFADFGRAPQEVINAQVLENSDLLVGIFGTRIGTATTTALRRN